MTDPLLPALTDFIFTAEEEAAVQFALSTDKPWKHDAVELEEVKPTLIELKKKIRAFHLERQNSKCCYCRMNLHGGGNFIIDREHIVPKEKFKTLTYVISNLSVACKRCNMELKKGDLSFLVDRGSILQTHSNADQYRFIHPNYEKYSLFIEKMSYEINDETYVKYTKLDHPKAHYTYTYFDLRALEVNTFDKGQGITTPDNASTVRERLAEEISALG